MITIMGVIVNTLRYFLVDSALSQALVCALVTAGLLLQLVRKSKSASTLDREHLNNLKPRDKKQKRKEAADDDDGDDEGSEEDEVPAIAEDTRHVPYRPTSYDTEEMIRRSRSFYEEMNLRRSVRFFSDQAVAEEVIENLVRTAGTSPSGAHTEPWTFVVVRDPEMKLRVREIVEEEEEINYTQRMGRKVRHPSHIFNYRTNSHKSLHRGRYSNLSQLEWLYRMENHRTISSIHYIY